MAEAVVTSVLEGVGKSIATNVSLINDAKHELERLENDVRLLTGFLHDTERNPDLEKQIKELLYHVQDIRESWLIHRARVRDRFLTSNIAGVYSLAREIVAVRDAKLDPTFRRIEAYGDLQLIQHQTSKVNQVPTVQLNIDEPTIGSQKLVGLEDEAESLITSLLKETEELDVISITGMPGIGKTALAWKIYQNDKIRTEFPIRIWIDIPLDFCSKDLYLNILKEFLKQGMASYDDLVTWLDMPRVSRANEIEVLDEFSASGRISDDQLLHALRACLKQKRFLFVIDDVWTADTLENIRYFLPNTGKVLITSRSNRVSRKPHVLRFLNEKESWELLQLEVFGKLGECPEILKSTGECIAKNCDGSPFAISVVASGLVVPDSVPDDLTETCWKKVSENVTTYITEYGAQHKVFERIELSYINLSQHLQHCFLYLGVFPEGDGIPVWTLMRLWIAEGLVQDSWGLTVEQTAERNLYDLINKNLVVVGKIYPNGQIKTCRLHKVIYGFCKTKAAEEEFYHEIRMSRGGALDSPPSLTLNHRRLCINSSSCLSEFLSSQPEGPCVRTILCLDKEAKVLHPKYSSTIDKSFKLLKIFECRGVKLTKFPRMLSRLLNLRYISLSCYDLNFIPESISSLCYLETLVVDTQSSSLRLKANIWMMLRLQHLVTKAAIVIVTQEKGEAGKILQTLSRLAPESCKEEVFRRTPNLKILGIQGRLAYLSDNFLEKLEFLEKLKLINEPAADSELHRLFRLDCFPPNLKRLTLSGTHLEWECMAILGKINSLEILKLKNNAFTADSWNSTDADGFGRLGFLLIGTTDLVSWEASPTCFPRLRCLVINNCKKLQKIPLTLAKSLDTLDVESISESAKESAKEIEQEIARRQGQSSW